MKKVAISFLMLITYFHIAQGASYRNWNYRFIANIPDFYTVCKTEPPAPDHGFSILLYHTDCFDARSGAFINVDASYNGLGDIAPETSAALAKQDCEHGAERRAALRISGIAFYRCREVDRPRRKFAYVGLRPDPEAEDAIGWNAFNITLYCPKGDCPAYTNVLQQVIEGLDLRLTPYEKPK